MSPTETDITVNPDALKAFIADMQAKLAASERARLASEQALAAEQEAHDATRRQVEAAQNAIKLTTLEIEKLKVQLARLRRMKFGQSSERLTMLADQLELTLEDMEAAAAHSHCVIGDVTLPEPAERPGVNPDASRCQRTCRATKSSIPPLRQAAALRAAVRCRPSARM